MFFLNFLNTRERKIHSEAHRVLKKVIRSSGNNSLPFGDLSIEEITKLSSAYSDYYINLKSEIKKSGMVYTHSLITEFAIALLDDRSFDSKKKILIEESTGPDDNTDAMLLLMEGHFYGRISADKMGNYMMMYLKDKKSLKVFIDFFNDIEENAKTNFCRYLKKFIKKRNSKDLAWALHYLQDITAPHHAGNYPLFFSKFTDDFDTHHGFEKKAREMINNKNNTEGYINTARPLYEELKDSFIPNKPEAFADMVFYKSSLNVTEDIKVKDEKRWTPVIEKAIPLAIAATAVVLEKYNAPDGKSTHNSD